MTADREDAPRIRVEFLVVAALFVALGGLRINDLFLYTPDSARYLIWGNSLARGQGYLDDTQPAPLRYVVHAPLYPALIAPVELFFPLRVVPVKIYTLAWGLAALLLLYLWLYHLFGRMPALGGAALLALNPGFLVYSTEALSEAPFTAALLLILFIMARSERRGSFTRAEWWTLLAAASLIGLLREVGIVVTAAVAVTLWFRERRKAVALAASAAVLIGAWYLRNSIIVGAPAGAPGSNAALVLQRFLTAPDASIVTELVSRTWANASAYALQAAGLLFFPLYGPQHMLLLGSPVEIGSAARWGVALLIGGTMASGVAASIGAGKGGRLPFITGMFLFAAAALYPVRDTRFLSPLLPLMIAFLAAGLASAGKRGRRGGWLTPAAACLILLPNVPALGELVRLNFRYNDSPGELHASLTAGETFPYYYTQPWGLLRAWIGDNIPTDAVLATPAKELALIAGGRKVLELDPGLPQSVFDRLLIANGVSYLLAPTRWADVNVYESLMSGSRRCEFAELRAAGNLLLYRVRYAPFDRDTPPPGGRSSPDYPRKAGGAAERFRSGWAKIRTGEYATASAFLDTASLIAPARSELRYAALVAASLRGDTLAAAAAFARLVEIPQSASFVASSMHHLRLAGEASAVSLLPDGEERAMRTLDVSRRYWELGHYGHAAGMLGREMVSDSAFFVGHLWNFHFHNQLGDTATARRELRRLDRIDGANSLVRNFHALMDLREAARAAPSPADRSALRLRMARINLEIELFDEAWDQALAAAADDPASPAAALFLAGLCLRDGNPSRARSVCGDFLAGRPDEPSVRAMADSLQRSLTP